MYPLAPVRRAHVGREGGIGMEGAWGCTARGAGKRQMKSVQHPVFPSGLLPQYELGLARLNFWNRTGSGVFPIVWPHWLALGGRVVRGWGGGEGGAGPRLSGPPMKRSSGKATHMGHN